ncbi:Predicted phosphodiesterase [Pseudooceanicola antarcticus]|uniref:Predicted phosphodiesterase n=2 Tax=Pseudooceanicola antarcticus TaxID=1247613 RepID=A0A285ITR7_9RHOB|nr:Predicted phosphodiesterase [Pseudooceanicola antarcticus]
MTKLPLGKVGLLSPLVPPRPGGQTAVMTFAVIADIHGNADALAAVLEDMQGFGVTQAVNLGDHFSGPLDAAGTAELLMARDFVSIRGNHDRWLLEQDPADMGPSDLAAFRQLPPEALDWLRALPATRRPFEGVFMCHGTPTSDLAYWLERLDAQGQPRAATLAEVEQEAGLVTEGLILCAHTHIPRIVRLGDGRVVLNPGSVGCPAYDDDHPVFHVMQTGTPNASYALVDRAAAGWQVSFRSVPYDAGRMVRMAEEAGRPDWARAVGTGWLT